MLYVCPSRRALYIEGEQDDFLQSLAGRVKHHDKDIERMCNKNYQVRCTPWPVPIALAKIFADQASAVCFGFPMTNMGRSVAVCSCGMYLVQSSLLLFASVLFSSGCV